jgi:hypothetical protein
VFFIKSIEEYYMNLKKISYIIILFTKKIENDFITIGKGMPFGLIKMSPCGQWVQRDDSEMI